MDAIAEAHERQYKARRLARPKYAAAIAWIGENDEPTCRDSGEIADQLTVLLVADVFGHSAGIVTNDVLDYRWEQWQKRNGVDKPGARYVT